MRGDYRYAYGWAQSRPVKRGKGSSQFHCSDIREGKSRASVRACFSHTCTLLARVRLELDVVLVHTMAVPPTHGSTEPDISVR